MTDRTVEFDRTAFFFDVQDASGGTSMKRWHLELLGYNVVSLSFWEWGDIGVSWADGNRRNEGVSKGKTAHFMILDDSSKECGY